MRFIINLFLTLLLSLSLSGLIGTLTLKSSNLSVVNLKTALIRANIYQELYRALLDNLDQVSQTGEADDLTRLLKPFIVKEITPAYIQTKSETLLDDLKFWLEKPGSPPPILSFTDLKEKLIQSNPKLVKNLLALEIEYQANKPEVKEGDPPLPDLNLSKYLESEPIIPIGSYLKPLVWLAWISSHWYLSLITLSLSLVLLYLVNASRRPLKTIGWCTLVAVVINALPLILTYFSAPFLTGKFLPQLPTIILPFITTLLTPLLNAYLKTTALILGISLITSLILLLIPKSKLPLNKIK